MSIFPKKDRCHITSLPPHNDHLSTKATFLCLKVIVVKRYDCSIFIQYLFGWTFLMRLKTVLSKNIARSWIEMFNRFSTATQMFDWLIDWLMDGLIDWLIDWLIHSFIHSFFLSSFFLFFLINWYQRKAEAAFPWSNVPTKSCPTYPNHTHYVRRRRKLRINWKRACCLICDELTLETSASQTRWR